MGSGGISGHYRDLRGRSNTCTVAQLAVLCWRHDRSPPGLWGQTGTKHSRIRAADRHGRSPGVADGLRLWQRDKWLVADAAGPHLERRNADCDSAYRRRFLRLLLTMRAADDLDSPLRRNASYMRGERMWPPRAVL